MQPQELIWYLLKIDYPLNLKNKQIKPIPENQKDLLSGSSIINIDNFDVVEIFGVNNENLNYFEDQLPIKVFQKGNQLNIKGEKNTEIFCEMQF